MDAARQAHWAEAIDTAHLRGRLLDPISDAEPLTLEEAYAIQALLTARRLARGDRRIGWKLGYTSAAMRAQMRVSAPNLAPLTDWMVLADGDAVDKGLAQPRVEPEIALRLGADLPAGATFTRAAAAVAETRAALEVVDSVWRGYRFRLEDNTADASSAAHVVLGPPLDPDADLAALPVVLLRHDGEIVGESRGGAAMGHPVQALRWLAGELARRGEALRAGDLVLTGGLTAAVPLRPGDLVSAAFAGHPPVSVRRNAAPGRPGAAHQEKARA